MSLSEKALLVSINISQWSGRKLDRDVTDEVNRQHNADADAGRYNKALLSKDALAAIAQAAGKARTEHYARTAPWLDDGTRILSSAGYLDYVKVMRGLRDDFNSAVADFVANYDAYVADARIRLNGMFKELDYPDAEMIAGRFRFERKVWPLPDAGDFRVDIGDAETAAIRADIELQVNGAIETAMRDVFGRVSETVGAMAEKLSTFKPSSGKGDKATGIFRDLLVGNVRDLIAVLPSLNVTCDAKLSAIAADMESLIWYDADALRQDEGARAEIAEKARAIVDDVAAYMA